jgi:hypothetical protein
MSTIAQNLWSMSYDLKEGGLVLNDVRHDVFSLARDIRVPRLWVSSSSDARNTKSFILNTPAMPAQGGSSVLSGGGSNSSVAPFNVYRTMFGLGASYKTGAPYLTGTPNTCDITVGQRYLFCDYGKNPPHEPGAVLEATRLFPLVDFSFPPVADPSKPYPDRLRVDYRIDVALDNIGEISLMTYQWRPTAYQDRSNNKGGVFRDNEDIGLVWPKVTNIFAGVEKPLKYEIASWGLLEGDPGQVGSKDRCWDNLHVWPATKNAVTDAVATPGAFHALHCHWRWGGVSGKKLSWISPSSSLLPSAGDQQFKGLGWKETLGGPLLDPRIPKQNLMFAVTKNDPDWAADRNPSGEDFLWQFQGKRAPDVIEKGDDLVVWFSFQVFRDEAKLKEAWEGTLFINGLYFGHNIDTTPLAVKAGGGYEEAANPFPVRKWDRPAQYGRIQHRI